MKRFLVVLALLAAPFSAHAAGRIIGIASPYSQVKEMAQKQGLMKKGSGERLYLKVVKQPSRAQAGLIAATVKGIGGMTGTQKNVTLAVGRFKVAQEVDGRIVSNGKFAIRTF